MFTTSELQEKINTYIAELQFTRAPHHLYEPISYVLSLGGKRIRPVLMLMAYNLYKEDIESILSPASAIEIYHNYTLLHDDLMDRAELRRGKKTVHKVWDDNTAILSGDAMLVLAYQYIAKCAPQYLEEVVGLFSRTALEICEGQQFDMDFEQRDDVKEKEYLEMIRLKTAVLLAASLKIGGLLGGASTQDAGGLYDFGVQIGIAFQLKDDLLDVYGDASVFGKNIGGDILCNKKTFMLIKALEHAYKDQKAELEHWLTAENYVDTEKIAAVTQLYDRIGVKRMAEEKIAYYSKCALSSLKGLEVAEEKKHELQKLIDKLMSREL